jgi:hypothetical protein
MARMPSQPPWRDMLSSVGRLPICAGFAGSLRAFSPSRRCPAEMRCAHVRRATLRFCVGPIDGITHLDRIAAIALAISARVVPPAAMPAACVKNLRRDVASTGWLWDMGVLVGGVLCPRSAWVIGFASLMARVRAEREVTALPRLAYSGISY